MIKIANWCFQFGHAFFAPWMFLFSIIMYIVKYYYEETAGAKLCNSFATAEWSSSINMANSIVLFCSITQISRLTVVNREAKEEVPCDSLSTNAHEYFTRTNLVKLKNAITDGPKMLGLYYSSQQMFLLGRSYKPKLKPAGPCIALYQHLTAFLYRRKRVTHESSLSTRK